MLAAVLCSAPFIVLAAWNIWTPYSFWYDELYSVLTCGGTWRHLAVELYSDVTNPPLYHVILKLWLTLFGSGEVQSRTLSLICAVGAFGLLCAAVRRRRSAFVVAATLFFSSSWLFPYYAQEARSYALLLLLATAATVMDTRRAQARNVDDTWLWRVVLACLALVHYFGLLYACILLLGDARRARLHGRSASPATLAVLGVMVAWPLWQLLRGGLGPVLGGHFWIQVRGILDTGGVIVQSLGVPSLVVADAFGLSGGSASVFWPVALVAGAVWAVWHARGSSRSEMQSLLARVTAVSGATALIDLHTPVSTPRNYIVLLPGVALLFGHTVEVLWSACASRWQRAALVLVLAAYSYESGVHAYGLMEERWAPRQNWKALAQSLESAGACRPHCWITAPANTHQYYFKTRAGDGAELTRLTVSELLQRQNTDSFPIVAAQIMRPDLDRLREHYADRVCLEPPQSWRGMVVLLAPAQRAPEGLLPCQ
ncbi:MAG: hypothetical protein ACHQ4J_10565 [Candidatus Binatia bacterium]